VADSYIITGTLLSFIYSRMESCDFVVFETKIVPGRTWSISRDQVEEDLRRPPHSDQVHQQPLKDICVRLRNS
jgi:hypothetical protein